jgi:hypothetical protein
LINLIAPQHDPRCAGVICSSVGSSNISRASCCQTVGSADAHSFQCQEDARDYASLITDSVFSINVSRSGYPKELRYVLSSSCTAESEPRYALQPRSEKSMFSFHPQLTSSALQSLISGWSDLRLSSGTYDHKAFLLS